MRFAFISTEKALYPVVALCCALGVTTSGYYAWLQRPKSAHAERDDALKVKVRAIHEESGRRYGEPRVFEALKTEGESTSHKRVARIMKEEQLVARKVRRFVATTNSNPLQRSREVTHLCSREEGQAKNTTTAAEISTAIAVANAFPLQSLRVVGDDQATLISNEVVQGDPTAATLGRRFPAHHRGRRGAWFRNERPISERFVSPNPGRQKSTPASCQRSNQESHGRERPLGTLRPSSDYGARAPSAHQR